MTTPWIPRWFNIRSSARAVGLVVGIELLTSYGDWREILGAVCVGVYVGTGR